MIVGPATGFRFARADVTVGLMCRNIRVLASFDPPTTDDEVRAAALQYVRKVTGTQKPSEADRAAFEAAIDEVARTTRAVIDSIKQKDPPRTREGEIAKAKARWARRGR